MDKKFLVGTDIIQFGSMFHKFIYFKSLKAGRNIMYSIFKWMKIIQQLSS